MGQENTGHICTSEREELNQFSVPKCYLLAGDQSFLFSRFPKKPQVKTAARTFTDTLQFHFLCCFYSMKCPSVSLQNKDTNLPNVKELQRIQNTFCVFILLVVMSSQTTNTEQFGFFLELKTSVPTPNKYLYKKLSECFIIKQLKMIYICI